MKAPGEKQSRNDSPFAPRDPLVTELAKAESDLEQIEAQRIAAKARIAALRNELAALDASPGPMAPGPRSGLAPHTPADKVKLFRQLFRGRPDLYPTRFVSKKTGTPGYAPACSNKFVPGICELPKVKCGDCTRQAFKPVDDAAVIAHLKGRHVMGVYPMQDDETCWFLAVDFDKSAWMDDVRAFVQTSRRMGLPLAVERSRSGNGAHVWFFFATPVAAATARRMGCHLITETMASRHELGMDSYDRLFPSQDTMPRGGFGNLIALPLQHGPRQEGNSVFLNDDLAAFPDEQQWAHLASIQRIDALTVEQIASDASRAGSVVGVRMAEMADEEDAAPWTRPPSGKARSPRITGPLPNRVSAVLSQRLFVAKAGLSSPLLNQIKRIAAFQNPEFYKKQGMRLSARTNAMTYSDWVLVSATVLGPVLAVQAQKWVERAREKRNRRNWVFSMLMATRSPSAMLSGDHVRALNTIDLAFYGTRLFGRHMRSKNEQAVIDAWREYLDHLSSSPQENAPDARKIQWLTRKHDLFVNLWQALASALNYEFDRVQLQKGIYSPIAHGTLEMELQAFRKLALELLGGMRALKVEVAAPGAPAPAAPAQPGPPPHGA